MPLARGAVVFVEFAETRGQELAGTHPCVVVSDPVLVAAEAYQLVTVVPVKSKPLPVGLQVKLGTAPSRLKHESYSLIANLRAIDPSRRIKGEWGRVSDAELAAIDAALRQLLGL